MTHSEASIRPVGHKLSTNISRSSSLEPFRVPIYTAPLTLPQLLYGCDGPTKIWRKHTGKDTTANDFITMTIATVGPCDVRVCVVWWFREFRWLAFFCIDGAGGMLTAYQPKRGSSPHLYPLVRREQ